VTAAHTLPQSPSVRKSGVLVLSGFGIRVKMECGHLSIEDGVGLERRKLRLPRVGHGLKRIIVIGSDGFATFDAIRWVADVGASLIFLDRTGKVIFVSGPTAPSDARLRRAQSTALGNGTALRISKEIIRQKLDGQAALVRDMLHNVVAAGGIVRFKADLPTAQSIEAVRIIEAQAAKLYWQAWSDVPVRWPRKDDRRVPDHWKRFGSRFSPLTHSPRLAANPPNAILNLLYAILEAESRIAAVAMGLDPGIGLLHVDTPSRDSLACDIMEVVRPRCDSFVLDWLQREPLRKTDFFEDTNGNCRLISSLAIRLCETADAWRKLVAPVAEDVSQELWASSDRSTKLKHLIVPTRLTQTHRREAKGTPAPTIELPKHEPLCKGCGQKILRGENCRKCAVPLVRKTFDAGRKMAQSNESLARRSITQAKHRRAICDWKPSDLPAWFTREVYLSRIVPKLATVPKSRIRSALGVSEPYSIWIQTGKRVPHARHWGLLAHLAGVGFEPPSGLDST
jgi:CRISPR-associated endonuclease Cas1